jgi:hypothetical protein
MADVKQPTSIPCQFEVAWVGTCKKPSTNGWCSKHENKKCTSCKQQAVQSCEYTSGPMSCGALLCATCTHSLDGEGHVTKEVYDKQWSDKKREKQEKELSRTSLTRRLNAETGLPLNLFELLKGDWKAEGYSLEECHYLYLQHGLMGTFPAIFKSDKEIILTTDQNLLAEIWKLLSPRRSQMSSFIGYVHKEKQVAFRHTDNKHEQEEITCMRLLDRQLFSDLTAKVEEPFGWAPGLIGADTTPKEFLETIQAVSKKFK